jgi:hypothetical protein
MSALGPIADIAAKSKKKKANGAAAYAASLLRRPSALIARSFISSGLRSPVDITLTIDFSNQFSDQIVTIGYAEIDQSAFISRAHNLNLLRPERTIGD